MLKIMAVCWIPIAITSRINAIVTRCAALGWRALFSRNFPERVVSVAWLDIP
jgi:hypothetical protein